MTAEKKSDEKSHPKDEAQPELKLSPGPSTPVEPLYEGDTRGPLHPELHKS